ncbi:DUF4179 domain-containing protein [Clostridium perfringens]|nr:DUF4179 domain-containing protein [Clostridium perfringens]
MWEVLGMKNKDKNEIKVPSRLDDVIKNTIKSEYAKEKIRYRGKLAVAGLAVILATGIIRPEFVSATVEGLKNSMGKFAINESVEYRIPDKYKTVIGKTIEHKGIKVTLEEFYIEDNILMIITKLDSRERNDYAQFIEPQICIDGKEVKALGNSNRFIHNEDGTVSILTTVFDENLELKSKMNIQVTYDEVGVTNIFDNDKYIKGEWQYDFDVNEKDFEDKIIKKNINKSLLINGEEKTINEISISPSIVVLDYENFNDFYIIRDEIGNEYLPEWSFSYGDGNAKAFYLVNIGGSSKIEMIPRLDNIEEEGKILEDEAITLNIR